MRWGNWVAVLLAAALGAMPAAHAQQPPPQQEQKDQAPDPQGPSPVDPIGDAIRGFFRSIFGDRKNEREGEIPVDPSQPIEEKNKEKEAATQPPPPSPQSPPVIVTPSAAPTQSLHAAIAKGDYAVAIRMIEQGTDVESKDPGAGASALHYAVMKGEMPLVALLVQRGADVNSRTRSGTTPLHTAVLYRRTEIAEYLIDKGADVNAKSPSGATPLGLALAANYHLLEAMLRTRGGH